VPERVKVGTRVGVGWQCGSCGACEWCTTGLESLCPWERATIVKHHGGFADAVRTDWRFAVPIPDAIDSAVAGPLFCAGNTVFTPLLRHNVNARFRTAVVGIGGLGHLAVQFLHAFACDVTAISTSHDKDEEAKGFGATRFIPTRGTDELKRAAGSFDLIMVTAGGTGLDWKALLDALRPQGKLVVAGPPEAAPPILMADLIGKEKSLIGGRTGSPHDITQMPEFAAKHGIKPLCQHFPMRDINAAVHHVRGEGAVSGGVDDLT
jgi:alcohol/geraniol dehydrogenase (NADP+)